MSTKPTEVSAEYSFIHRFLTCTCEVPASGLSQQGVEGGPAPDSMEPMVERGKWMIRKQSPWLDPYSQKISLGLGMLQDTLGMKKSGLRVERRGKVMSQLSCLQSPRAMWEKQVWRRAKFLNMDKSHELIHYASCRLLRWPGELQQTHTL